MMSEEVEAENAGNEEIEQFPDHEDALLEDPRQTCEPRELAERVRDVIDGVQWRLIARDGQLRAHELIADLDTPRAEIRARRDAASRPLEIKPPETEAEVRVLLAQMLSHCLRGFERLTARSEPRAIGMAASLGHAAARLARTMKEFGEEPGAQGEQP